MELGLRYPLSTLRYAKYLCHIEAMQHIVTLMAPWYIKNARDLDMGVDL